jgi:hypothetical protein
MLVKCCSDCGGFFSYFIWFLSMDGCYSDLFSSSSATWLILFLMCIITRGVSFYGLGGGAS